MEKSSMKNDFQIRPPPILINQIRQKNSKLWVYELIRLDFSGQNFYCGIDIHKKNWAVTIETDDISLKTFSQEADPG